MSYSINEYSCPSEVAFTSMPYEVNIMEAKKEDYRVRVFKFVREDYSKEEKCVIQDEIKEAGLNLNFEFSIANDPDWKQIINYIERQQFVRSNKNFGWNAKNYIEEGKIILHFIILKKLIAMPLQIKKNIQKLQYIVI